MVIFPSAKFIFFKYFSTFFCYIFYIILKKYIKISSEQLSILKYSEEFTDIPQLQKDIEDLSSDDMQ